jgi:hypothetical protein
MFFFRVAPGVRLRFTRTGVRAGLGPRAARLHIGDGGLGASTGVGPFAYYQSLGGSRRGGRSATGGANPGSAAYERALRAASATAEIEALLTLHDREFTAVQPPVAPMPAVPDLATLTDDHVAKAQRGISFLRFGARRAARDDARVAARAEHARLVEAARAEQQRTQAAWDAWWAELCAGDRDATLEYVNLAFDDNAAPAAAVEMADGELAVVVRVPDERILPEREPTTTATGNATTRLMPKGRRAELYAEVVYAFTLLTVREAFAVAPGVRSVQLAAVRGSASDTVDVLLGCAVERTACDRVTDWRAPATQILRAIADDVVERRGRGGLAPIDLDDQPELAALLAASEVTES